MRFVFVARRSRKQRRFSSVSPNGQWKNAFAPLQSNNSFRHGGRNSMPSSPLMTAPYLRLKHEDAVYDVDDVRETRDLLSPDRRPFLLSQSSQRPTAYTSLPPTPISVTPTSVPTSPASTPPVSPFTSAFSNIGFSDPPFSLWDYLREEILATDFDSHQELKWERVSNFLSIPLAMEKVDNTYLRIYSCLIFP